MGIEPFLLASSLLGVLGQRLIRLSCTACHGQGCDACAHSGYAGRAGIYELMQVTESLQSLIHEHAAESELRKQACADGMRTLTEDCQRWVESGATTREEMMRVTGNVHLD